MCKLKEPQGFWLLQILLLVLLCANMQEKHPLRTQVDEIIVHGVTVQRIDKCSSLHPLHEMLFYIDICSAGGQQLSSELMLDIGSAVSILPEPIC